MIPGPQKILNLPLSHHKRVESDPTSPSSPQDTHRGNIDFVKVPVKNFESDYCLLSPKTQLTQQQLSTGLPKSNQQFFSTLKLETYNELNNLIKQPTEQQEVKIESSSSIALVKVTEDKIDNKSAVKGNDLTANEETKVSINMKNSCDKTESASYQFDKPSIRCDTFGIPIQKGGKKHKLIFDENITVVIIENWKEYNTDLSQKPSIGCRCQVF